MPKNLDLTALRSFVVVAETGGVTKAAGFLNLTQSAVSMQLKRLEESLGTTLFSRAGRGLELTAHGDQLLSSARRMLLLNDEIFTRLMVDETAGEVVLGVPHDLVYPHIPGVLRRFAQEYPRVKVQLRSSFTLTLKEQFARGEVDVMLTTEDEVGEGGEVLGARDLVWIGAPDGQAWRKRPLPLAYEHACIFRPFVQRRLDEEGVDWEMAVFSESTRSVEATLTADLAVHTSIAGAEPPHLARIDHGGALPHLRAYNINLYHASHGEGPIVEVLADLIRQAYAAR